MSAPANLRNRLGQGLRSLRGGQVWRPAGQNAANRPVPSDRKADRLVAEQVFSRIAGAAPVAGNAILLLRDGAENFPAWLAAIEGATTSVHLENYIFRADKIGTRFAESLAAKARSGVPVRVLIDWMGCLNQAPRSFWARLRAAGVEVRTFNRPRLDSPFGWLSRNHRKTISVDGRIGFVAGLCIGDAWMGDPARNQSAWRDTGIAIEGPAVTDLDTAFAEIWSYTGGGPIAPGTPAPSPALGTGHVSLRVIASKPNTMGLYRFDQLIAGIARRTLWLTDAYFVGTTAYVRTLCDAARDGVDVRLLVPGASDIPVAKALSRAGYRPLLEAGIRVFEWDGPMLHAKTAVADGHWARIGSSNLNLASWLGNWELDVAIEDRGFAAQMEAMFKDDLAHATEIVLDVDRVHSAPGSARPASHRTRRGSPGRLAAGAVGLGSAVSAAMTNHRALGPAEAQLMAVGAAVLLVMAGIAVAIPRLLTIPVAVVAAWVAVTLLVRAWRLRTAPADAEPSGAP